MKNNYRLEIILSLLFTFILAFSFAQGGPGDPGGDPTGTGNPLGGSASVSGGIILMLILCAVYALIKFQKFMRKDTETNRL